MGEEGATSRDDGLTCNVIDCPRGPLRPLCQKGFLTFYPKGNFKKRERLKCSFLSIIFYIFYVFLHSPFCFVVKLWFVSLVSLKPYIIRS